MSNIARRIAVISGLVFSLSACATSPQQASLSAHSPQLTVVNCKALKRQQLYNETNMNTETNDTSLAQKQALQALIAKNCR